MIPSDATQAEYTRATTVNAAQAYPEPFSVSARGNYGNPTPLEWPVRFVVGNDDANLPPLDICMRILFFISRPIGGQVLVTGLDIIVVAVYKRSTVSDQFVEKIRTGIRDDLNKQVDIESAYLSTFCRHFGFVIIDTNILVLHN